METNKDLLSELKETEKEWRDCGDFSHGETLLEAIEEIERLTNARPRCHAQRNDGECGWQHCPQNIDGEPTRSGRHCPLDLLYVDDEI